MRLENHATYVSKLKFTEECIEKARELIDSVGFGEEREYSGRILFYLGLLKETYRNLANFASDSERNVNERNHPEIVEALKAVNKISRIALSSEGVDINNRDARELLESPEVFYAIKLENIADGVAK